MKLKNQLSTFLKTRFTLHIHIASNRTTFTAVFCIHHLYQNFTGKLKFKNYIIMKAQHETHAFCEKITSTTLFKVPHHPLQSTTPPSSNRHTTLFKVAQHPHQSTTPPSSKYHITLFKVLIFYFSSASAIFLSGGDSIVTSCTVLTAFIAGPETVLMRFDNFANSLV